jgi:hypothetical protein
MRFSSGSGSRPTTAGIRHAERLKKPSLQPSQYAAGGKKTPIMLANVVVSADHTAASTKSQIALCAKVELIL